MGAIRAMPRRHNDPAQAIQLLLARAKDETVAAGSAVQVLVGVFAWGHVATMLTKATGVPAVPTGTPEWITPERRPRCRSSCWPAPRP
jgi:hypothetical protein